MQIIVIPALGARPKRAKLVVAFAVLAFASLACVEQIDISTGVITIPDGSTVTSITFIPFPHGVEWGNTSLVDYSFLGGTGETEGNSLLGFDGMIDFTAQVSDVSFTWLGVTLFMASDNVGDRFLCDTICPAGTEAFQGTGITEINWQAGDEVGGISSMTFTVNPADPPSVPEPSSLMLAGMGAGCVDCSCASQSREWPGGEVIPARSGSVFSVSAGSY